MSWKTINLGELLTESRLLCEAPNANRRIRVKLNVAGVEKRPVENEIEGATRQFIRRAGQFIFGKQNFHKGAFGIIPPELDGFETSADIPSFDVAESCLPEWIFYHFKAGNRYLDLAKLARGVGSKRIHPEQIYNLQIPLPSLDEQKEIIQRCQTIEATHLSISTEFDHQQQLLTDIRQAFLREAMQGKLVPQDHTDEPAAALLARIREEKAARIKAGTLRKEKPLPAITEDEKPYDLPAGWEWCRLGSITFSSDYGTSEKATDNSQYVPVLRMNNIQSGKVVLENLKYLQPESEDLPGLFLKYNDLLFNRTNSYELVGKAGVFKGESNTTTFTSYLIRIQFGPETSPDFVNYYLNSTICRLTQIEPEIIQQNGQANFNGTKLSNILMPLPPLAEQHRIVAKLEQVLSQCDDLAASIAHSRAQAEQLLQAALREALAPPAGPVEQEGGAPAAKQKTKPGSQLQLL